MSEWIEWNGEKCPVDKDAMVYLRFAHGGETSDPGRAGTYWWGGGLEEAGIIAYRLAEPVTEAVIMPAIVTEPVTGPAERFDAAVDMVNHPPHYTAGGIECIDAIRAALTTDEFRGHCKANAMKYIWRERNKGGDESIRKAIWYLQEMLK